MAGSDPQGTFVASEFRDAIKSTMRMGMPQSDNEKLKFHFAPVLDYEIKDPALQPYDWKAQPEMDIPGNPEVPSGWMIVDYALEFAARPTDGSTEVGRFDTSRIIVTVLDVDYQKVKTADYAMIKNTHYDINFVGPPIGLFDVTTYQFYMQARDQT